MVIDNFNETSLMGMDQSEKFQLEDFTFISFTFLIEQGTDKRWGQPVFNASVIWKDK